MTTSSRVGDTLRYTGAPRIADATGGTTPRGGTLTVPYPREPTTLGEHLKRRRYELGLFQKEAARQMGVNESTFLNWENDTCPPMVRMLPRIIDFLGYDPYPVSQSFSDELVATRRRLGLSRKRMAKRLGIDEAGLSRWEKGLAYPRGKRLATVKGVLVSVRV